MHILSIAPCFSINGVSVHVEQINRALLAVGERVTIAPLQINKPHIVQCKDNKRRVHPLVWHRDKADWFNEKLALAEACVDAIGCMEFPEPVQLVHSHDWLAAWVGEQLAKRFACPHLSTVHTLAEIQRQRCGLPGRLPAHLGQIAFEKRLCQTPDTILTVSHAMKEMILEIGAVAPSRVQVIPNGVDLQRFATPSADAVTALRQHLAPNGEQLVLFVGRLAPQKGVDFLLKSTYQVRRERPSTRWIIVGDHVAAHMMKPVYEQIMSAGGHRDHLYFAGELPWYRIPLYLHAADCLVLPSLFEVCPYVLLEAMAAGTCVIASDLKSLREIIVHKQNGLLVPMDKYAAIRGPSIAELALAQLQVLAAPALRRRLADAAKKTVEYRFSINRQFAAIQALYKQLLTQRGAVYAAADSATAS